MKKTFLSIAAIAIIAFSCNHAVTGNYGPVNAKRFAAISDSLNDEQIVDVRSPEEFNSGHLKDALNMDWNADEFEANVAKLDKNKTVMVYCLSGQRSRDAADWMRKNGFPKVYEMQNGILAWKTDGLPVIEEEVAESKADENVSVSTGDYKTMVNSQSIVLADFSATWCGPCKMLAPRLEELENDMKGKFRLIKLDADRDRQLSDSMNIAFLPTLFLYKGGELVWKSEGLVDKDVIAEQIKIAERK